MLWLLFYSFLQAHQQWPEPPEPGGALVLGGGAGNARRDACGAAVLLNRQLPGASPKSEAKCPKSSRGR